MVTVTRRRALQAALIGGAAACSAEPARTPYQSASPTNDSYFRHGVASGDPGPDSVVIWTRFFNEALSVTPGDRAIRWQVAEDAEFRAIAAEGEKSTGPAADFTVKQLVEGLKPGAIYFLSLQPRRSNVAGRAHENAAGRRREPSALRGCFVFELSLRLFQRLRPDRKTRRLRRCPPSRRLHL